MMPMCSTEEYANSRLKLPRRTMNSAPMTMEAKPNDNSTARG